MDGGKDLDVAGDRRQAGGPGDGLQHSTVKVGIAAVTDPARNGQHKLQAGLITLLHQVYIVFPGIAPALFNLGDGHTAGTVGGKDPQFQRVGVVHRTGSGHKTHLWRTICLLDKGSAPFIL